jgi:hypothetical protein
MTQITFDRTGGFMGRKVSFSLNLDDLPTRQSKTLQRLLDQADFFNLPENLIAHPRPDEFTYSITVEGAVQRRTVRLSDSTATDALRPLLDNLSKRARSARVQKNSGSKK